MPEIVSVPSASNVHVTLSPQLPDFSSAAFNFFPGNKTTPNTIRNNAAAIFVFDAFIKVPIRVKDTASILIYTPSCFEKIFF